MSEFERAITYFEDAVRESDEIIKDCSPTLQAELNEQKQHFITGLEALREQAEREKGCEYCNSALAPLYKISTNWHPPFALFEPAVCPVCGKRLEVEP